jgi:steroid delta-isomerase-like uncharacterized protein
VTAKDILATMARMTQAINDGTLDDLSDMFAEDLVDHAATAHVAPANGKHISGFKEYFGALREAFPDLTLEPNYIDATDADVVMQFTVNGTHRGKFLGIEPTGMNISVTGMHIVRFVDGKIVERRDSSLERAIFKQLTDGHPTHQDHHTAAASAPARKRR